MATYASRPAWGLRARSLVSAWVTVPLGIGALVAISLLLRTTELGIGFWIDGGLDSSHAAGLTFGKVLEPLFVGANPLDGAYLDGAVDDVRVYNWALPFDAIDALGDDARGLSYRYHEGVWQSLPDFDSLPVVESGAVANVTPTVRNRDDYYALRFDGCVEIPTGGTYRESDFVLWRHGHGSAKDGETRSFQFSQRTSIDLRTKP